MFSFSLFCFSVKYRIFTLDNYMIPIKDELHVQIIVSCFCQWGNANNTHNYLKWAGIFLFLQNCKGFIVYNHIFISEQILEKTITIPDVEQ